MKTREELNSEIQIEILAEIQKSNEPVVEKPELTKFERRNLAMKEFRANSSVAKREAAALAELSEAFKNR